MTAMALERARDASREASGGRIQVEVSFEVEVSQTLRRCLELARFPRLRFHDRPVLAVAVAGVHVANGGVAVVAATGATDGAIAIWDVTRATEERARTKGSEDARNRGGTDRDSLRPHT